MCVCLSVWMKMAHVGDYSSSEPSFDALKLHTLISFFSKDSETGKLKLLSCENEERPMKNLKAEPSTSCSPKGEAKRVHV